MSIARTIFPDVNVVCRARVAVGTGALTILRTDNITGPFPHVLPPFRLTVCNGYLGAFLRRIDTICRTAISVIVIAVVAILPALNNIIAATRRDRGRDAANRRIAGSCSA